MCGMTTQCSGTNGHFGCQNYALKERNEILSYIKRAKFVDIFKKPENQKKKRNKNLFAGLASLGLDSRKKIQKQIIVDENLYKSKKRCK